MTKRAKAGQFSPISLEALEMIANRDKKEPRLLLAYLALARHTTMMNLDGRGPNMLTGAGAQKVRNLTNCGTSVAAGLVKALDDMGVIQKAAPELPIIQARWAMQHRGDVNIPHALIDGVDGSDGIGRLLKADASNEVVVCAIMLLINCYAEHDMEKFGGISHRLIWRNWEHLASTEGDGVKVAAEPKTNTASLDYINKIIGSMGGKVNDENNGQFFWKAFNLLKNTGLFYEVVTAINVDSERLPIRVNDFHSTASDPSLLDNAAGIIGAGYYTHKDNDRAEPESCWFYLPSKPESVIGIWRLRFRCSTPKTAKGIALDEAAVDRAITDLAEQDILYIG